MSSFQEFPPFDIPPPYSPPEFPPPAPAPAPSRIPSDSPPAYSPEPLCIRCGSDLLVGRMLCTATHTHYHACEDCFFDCPEGVLTNITQNRQ